MHFKRLSRTFLLCLALLLGFSFPAFAAQTQTITVDPINIMVGGKDFLPTDVTGKNVPVFAYNGTTYAPIRALAEAYGLTVSYNAEHELATVEGTASANFAGTRGTARALTERTTLIVVSIRIMVNGTLFEPKDVNGNSVSVFAYNGTTYAPVRALAEAYGLSVGYDPQKNLATVDFANDALDSFIVWDGTCAQNFTKGIGVASNPYVIETPQQLAYLAAQVNSGKSFSGKYFTLASDLDLAHIEWTPIGSYGNPFNGHFDGCGHKIKGLSITKAEIDTTGQNSWHNSIECIGLFGAADGKSYIANLYINGTIDINKPEAPEKDDVCAGGIVGLTRGTVYNCHNACNISVSIPSEGTYINIGGVSGCYTWETGLIDSCSNAGTLYGSGIHVVRLGGVAGDNDGHGIVRNCINYGSVQSNCPYGNDYRYYYDYVGGLVAHTANSLVYNCANYGHIQGTNIVGGIVARQYGTISFGGGSCIINCLSAARVETDFTGSPKRLGAICGNVDAEDGVIDKCYYNGIDVATGTAPVGEVKSITPCSSLSPEELLVFLNEWVAENNTAGEIYVAWILALDGRIVPDIGA